MMRATTVLMMALVLSGCAIFTADIGYGPGGVSVRPAVTTVVGGVNLTASP